MAKVFIEESTLTAIGDAIRGKEGTTELIPTTDMATRISAIEGGGGGGSFYDVISEEDCVLTGNCKNAFYKRTDPKDFTFYTWMLQNHPEKLKTQNIESLDSMFYGQDTLEEIPFSLNVGKEPQVSGGSIVSMFRNCKKLKSLPPVTLTGKLSSFNTLNYVFESCFLLREIPEDWELFLLNVIKATKTTVAKGSYMFQKCYSLRHVPESILTELGNYSMTSNYNHFYYYGLYYCYCLDEIKGLGSNNATLTSNMFINSFSWCSRAKDITFQLENGAPAIRSWKSQTLNLGSSTYIGYAQYAVDITNHNSGITADKQVTDDATYQALKNDPDWWTMDVAYSRYNHDSAVNTINSLPDTSAYLATAGGTNTIKFVGNSGEKTDGGAINTLTDDEKDVAALKGWTVQIV